MIVHNVEQNSLDWLALRAGVVTASEVDAIVSDTFKIRTGEMPKTYLAQKLAEKWLGGPLPGFMTLEMDLGKLLEEFAIPAYEWESGEKVTKVGFITTDDGSRGCSPDGLIGEGEGIEVKCPTAAVHMKYLLADSVPAQYLPQIYFSMYVTQRKRWKFCSYHRKMPMLVKTVEWDEQIDRTLDKAVADFCQKMREGWDKLVALNGGKPPTRKTFTPTEPTPEPNFDIVP